MIPPVNKELSPDFLDKQSKIKIHRWVNIGSEEYRMIDDIPDFTKKCMRIGFEEGFMFADIHGRLWGKDRNKEIYFPFHIDYDGKNYGFRVASAASN